MMTSRPGTSRVSAERGFCKLSVTHLLLLILINGVVLAYVAPTTARLLSDSRYPWSERWWVASVWLAQSTSHAWAWFGLIVLTREVFAGRCRDFSPGHWIVLVQGIAAFGIVADLLRFYFHSYGPMLQSLGVSVGYLVLAALACKAALHIRSRPWKFAVGALVFCKLAYAILFAFRAAELEGFVGRAYEAHGIAAWVVMQVIVFVAVLFAVTTDLRAGVQRDWLHFTALVILALELFSTLGMYGEFPVRWFAHYLPLFGCYP